MELCRGIQEHLVLKLTYLNHLVGMQMRITFFSALEEMFYSLTQHIITEGIFNVLTAL